MQTLDLSLRVEVNSHGAIFTPVRTQNFIGLANLGLDLIGWKRR